MAGPNTAVKQYSYDARKVLIVGANGTPITESSWTLSKGTTGAVGASIPVTPKSTSNKTLYEVNLSAPNASENSTVVVYKDGVAVGSACGSTAYLLSLPNGTLKFPGGQSCVGKWIVVVTGGSGNVYVQAKYN